MTRDPTIIALGGGGFGTDPPNGALDRHLLALVGTSHPRVCFIPTASGDDETYVTRFFDAFARSADATWLPLFARRDEDLRTLLLEQDLLFIGGGNTANMLAVWRLHGVDAILREAWAQGTVLAGVSAGGLCWFERGVTDSFGPSLAPLDGLLGLLPGSFCPHYDAEPLRRPRLHELVAAGRLPATLACDDGVAVVFRGTELVEAVTDRDGASAYRVELAGGGSREGREVREMALPTRRLP